MGAYDSSTYLQHLLDLHQAGHDSARAGLLQHALERLQQVARRMFRCHPDWRALHETDDVLQEALLRLHRALAEVRPGAVRAFFALAARQIRWVLLDLARKAAAGHRPVYTGHAVPSSRAEPDGPEDADGGPSDLLEWTEFHKKIEDLPADEREMFDLLFYEGLSQEEAGLLLGVSVRTVKRRWQQARLLLRAALRGSWPALPDGGRG
jgi:RNA polymerase sigma-70 factor (ECF subfamily)